MKNNYTKKQLILFMSFLIIVIIIILIKTAFNIKINTYIIISSIIINQDEIQISIKEDELKYLEKNTSIIIDNKSYSFKIENEKNKITDKYYQIILKVDNLNYDLLEQKEITIYKEKISIIRMIGKGVGFNETIN